MAGSLCLAWCPGVLAQDTGGASDRVFVATPLTAEGAFTEGIEGPACDITGNVYAVNYQRQGTIGRVRPDGTGEVYLELPEGSVGNGIRFGPRGEMYVADYVGHNVFEVDPDSRALSVHAHHGGMHQPNDLAIGPDGMLYASDPNWDEGTGQLWRIAPDGGVTRIAARMGTTNGIEVSPDGQTLYVAESVQRTIWAFRLDRDGGLSERRAVIRLRRGGRSFGLRIMPSTACEPTSTATCTSHATARERSLSSPPPGRSSARSMCSERARATSASGARMGARRT